MGHGVDKRKERKEKKSVGKKREKVWETKIMAKCSMGKDGNI